MFRSYRTGQEFLEENEKILGERPLEACFFAGNAKGMPDMSQGFAVKVSDGERVLLAIRFRDFPMVLYGDEALCAELAAGLVENDLHFGAVLANPMLTEAFFPCYEALAGGSHRLKEAMDIMKCERLNDTDTAAVELSAPGDTEELAGLLVPFYREALGEHREASSLLEEIRGEAGRFALVRREGKIVSIAWRVRESDETCAISGVYTREEYRGQGLARQTVTCLTKQILADGKLPYLFVDKANPISNHLYRSIGYIYDVPQIETAYIPATQSD